MILKSMPLLIIFSLFLISLDAYEFYGIPISWLGNLVLFLISFKSLIRFKFKNIYFIVIFLLLFPGILITLFNLNFDNLFYVILRVFNIIAFFSVYFYVKNSDDENLDLLFNNYIRVLLNLVSIFAIYIFIAQIFDFPEINRNRPGTSFFSDTKQSTFWLSQPHRAMGTFREPSFLVAFLFPILFLFIKNNQKNNFFTIVISSIAIGFSRSDYAKVICLLILFFEIYLYFKSKNFNFKILICVSIIYFFSTFGILECNINPNSKDCIKYSDVVRVINSNQKLKIKTETNNPINNLDNERLNSVFYFYNLMNNLNPNGLGDVNTSFQVYSYNSILEEMYLTNRTLPKYLLSSYDAQNFGTGNYSLLNFKLNIQNVIFFYTSAFGLQIMIAFFCYLIYLLYKFKLNERSFIFFIMLLIVLISPIEEVSSFIGFILGYCALKLNTKIKAK